MISPIFCLSPIFHTTTKGLANLSLVLMATLSVPDPVPSAVEDAEDLRQAFKGWGTDEKAVIKILAHRDARQRAQIRHAYEGLYEENLIKRLESELSGHIEKAVYRWMFDPVERAAIMANVALKKEGPYQVIVEIACVNSGNELLAVKQAYHARYRRSLEEDVASYTAGSFRKLLVGLVGTYRYEGEEVDAGLAHREAFVLGEVIKQHTLDDDEIIRIISTRSKAQLNATFNRYKDEFGVSITKDLANGSPSELAWALHAAVRCIIEPHKYFGKVLRDAICKGGTDEDALTRVVVMHAEKDLQDIKQHFKRRTDMALEDAVSKETSGHYKRFLLALIGY